ncbi:hypothetical protein BC834DRAFT_236946 [Gloeopeniophorella convolvens]|nr:hypothetical protein BC834DRAFT_236946 [Gloeopeniophorella convolvens]
MSFISPEDRAYMSPSSSPSASPAPSSYFDSSPISTPFIEPLELERPGTPLGIVHPFAGSTHATAHPSNELRYSNSSYEPAAWAYRAGAQASKSTENSFEDLFNEQEGFSASEGGLEPPDEDALWEERITSAVDTGVTTFTWKDAGLTFVPSSIAELNALGVIPGDAQELPQERAFKRVQTAPPAVFSSPHRSSFQNRIVSSHSQSKGLMVFLANNEIKSLPLEFFKLSNLTVLSLRNNRLEHLPPEIVQLRALKDLDLVNNNLRFLPAEMTTMTLAKLTVHTNPWLPDPATTAASSSSTPSPVPPPATQAHFRVPPLREFVLRYLLTPSPGASGLRTALEDRFQLPLQDGALPPADAELLARLAPAAVSAPRQHALSRATSSASAFSAPVPAAPPPAQVGAQSVGRCPALKHGAGAAWARAGPPFVRPAEERYAWVTQLAGVHVGETTGGVPVLWRGCGRGCLDFLDVPEAAEEQAQATS